MTLNYPGPMEARFFYTTTVSSVALQHVQHLSFGYTGATPVPGDLPGAIVPTFRVAGGTNTDMEDVINDWVVDFKALLSSGAGNTIDSCELWHYEPESFDAEFISSMTIAVAGTSGSSTVAAGQSIVTMRTQQGGIFKLSFMETVLAAGVTDSGTISSATLETMVSQIEAGQQYPWLARDTSFPLSRIAHYPGINEKLWKKRFRP